MRLKYSLAICMNGELWQNVSALDQHLRRIDQVLGLTLSCLTNQLVHQLVPRAPSPSNRFRYWECWD